MSRKQKIVREIFSYIRIIAMSIAIVYVLNHTIIANAQVLTGSMENTVMTGSRVFVNRTAYLINPPKRGDIITFKCPDQEEEEFMKRIVGLPGETIKSVDGKIYIDETELSESYIKEVSYMDFGPYVIPEDAYFVMGDNRCNSWDSRYWNNKFVYKDAIIGRAELEYYPELKSFR